ncbi:unnamed protein product [Allacma fusca]|uniref:Ionotropic glutamate receptor C-terminal domain-containing protein n=1 Tax=Allacma fusca TaxID=39272 RepID=A0A8J2LJG7_9HEXA|nr:unnamed protein product [Allacma fusca]
MRGVSNSERTSLELKFIEYTSGKLNDIISKKDVKGTKILTGTHLQGSALFAPYMIRKNSKGKIIGGMHFVFMETISKCYNFSYELEATPGRGTGHQLTNGTWTHLMGDIVHGQKDFVTVTAPTASRYGIIDMTSYTFTVNVIFYSRFPRTHVQWESIVHPFKPSLWAGVVLAFISIVTLFYVTLRVHNGRINCSKQTKAHHLYLSLMIPAAMLLDQEGHKPKCVWKVDIIWMFFVMIVGACYKDQLVGFLTLPASEPIPRTFQDLHNHNDYHLFFFYMASTPSMYFKSTANPIHRALFSRFDMIRSGQKCVMKAAVTERSVCVGLDNQLAAAVASNLTIKTQFQPLILSQEKLIPFFACFGLPINSVYTEAFDQISLATTESGLGGKWYQDSLDFLKRGGKSWMTNDMKDTLLFQNVRHILLDRESNVKPLQVKHFKAIWGVGGVVIILSVVTFGFECLRFRNNPSNSQINKAKENNLLFFPVANQSKPSPRLSRCICKIIVLLCPKIPTYPKL